MLRKSSDNIIKSLVVRFGKLNLNNLPKLVLECFRTTLLHLLFRKGFPVTLIIQIVIVEIITDGIYKSTLQALFAEELGHLIQITLISAVGLARVEIAVADKKMCVDMLTVCMHRKQNFKALVVHKLFRKIPCNFVCFTVGKLIVIIRMKRYGQLVCKNCIRLQFAVRLSVQLSCNKNTFCEIITITAESVVQIVRSFNRSVTHLFRLLAEHIQCGGFKLTCGFAGLVIYIHISEGHLITLLGMNRGFIQKTTDLIEYIEIRRPHSEYFSLGFRVSADIDEVGNLIEIYTDFAKLIAKALNIICKMVSCNL